MNAEINEALDDIYKTLDNLSKRIQRLEVGTNTSIDTIFDRLDAIEQKLNAQCVQTQTTTEDLVEAYATIYLAVKSHPTFKLLSTSEQLRIATTLFIRSTQK